MSAYYNEIDPFAAAWLRELIKAGQIAPGHVDERSIEDVRPDELAGYTQCHFFAGIGVWSYALRCAGWPDDKPVWTGSCPCQPFSAAGKGGGFDDERHLWPAFHWLIAQCQPPVVIGEQVDAAIKNGWWDLVATDAEALGYAAAGAVIPASAVGAPNIRHRLFFILSADTATNNESKPRDKNQDLYKMPECSAADGVLSRKESERRAEVRLQNLLSEQTTKASRATESGGESKAYSAAQGETCGGGAAVLETSTPKIQGQRADKTGETQSEKEGAGFRPGRSHSADNGAGREERVRGHRDNTAKDGTESVQQPIAGSDKSGSRVHLQQRESGLLCAQLCAGDVGQGAVNGNSAGTGEEGGLDATKHTVQAYDKDEGDSERKECNGHSGIGAPHIRDRAYWVGLTERSRLEGFTGHGNNRNQSRRLETQQGGPAAEAGGNGGVADANTNGLQSGRERSATARHGNSINADGGSFGLGNTKLQQRPSATTSGNEATGRQQETAEASGLCSDNRAGPTNGFWADADWLGCRDGKFRPVEPGTFPLVDGAANRVGRLRGYGNAINAQAAKVFIEACLNT